jgi:hypothetical protein
MKHVSDSVDTGKYHLQHRLETKTSTIQLHRRQTHLLCELLWLGLSSHPRLCLSPSTGLPLGRVRDHTERPRLQSHTPVPCQARLNVSWLMASRQSRSTAQRPTWHASCRMITAPCWQQQLGTWGVQGSYLGCPACQAPLQHLRFLCHHRLSTHPARLRQQHQHLCLWEQEQFMVQGLA